MALLLLITIVLELLLLDNEGGEDRREGGKE